MASPLQVPQTIALFRAQFEALTGNAPYHWQQELFDLFVAGRIEPDINLPTGAGKTSIIPIWLLALAHQAAENPRSLALPRRLVWVVNRRVVVDQATDEADAIRKRLADLTGLPTLDPVRNSLRQISLDRKNSELIAISTLRGEKEDNREWSDDPSRPAIIVGTVDMIGSRLLFSGYGNGPYWRAQHAGLLGHDALIVNDEAHLTPAFAKLLSSLESIQRSSLKPFRTIRLSATHAEGQCWPESLETDRADERFRRVFEAKKKLLIQTVPSGKLEQTISELASQTGTGRTVVFVTEPEKARKVATAIRKKVGTESGKRVLTLTGTMRGFERDQLVLKDEFKPFFAKARPDEDYWLVATSAGEVGINISSERVVTGSDTLDHLIQRFGRLNRFGETEGRAYLVVSDKEKEERAEALKILKERLSGSESDGYDISPRALFGFSMNEEACSPKPLMAPLHPWHIDVWSQTSLSRHPARPPVEPWLHGKEDNLPETYIAWREYVDLLADPQRVAEEDRDELFKDYPLLTRELLREPTGQLLNKLKKMFEADDRTVKIIRRAADGATDAITLPKIETKLGVLDIRDERTERLAIRELAYAQLILPPGFGVPEDGMFHPERREEGQAIEGTDTPISYDVSGAILRQEQDADGKRTEARAAYRAERQGDGKYLLHPFGGFPGVQLVAQEIDTLDRDELEKFAALHGFRFLLDLRARDDETESSLETVLLFFGPARKTKSTLQRVLFVSQHNNDVARLAQNLCERLGISTELTRALSSSGGSHDLGKKRSIWQRAAGNWDVKRGKLKESEPIAKPLGLMRGRQLGGFRHELASLLDAEAELELSPENRDLYLHVIACHHGHARPCFRAKAYDRENLRASADEALETARRFARLQRRYGAWGLAYLESILRAADGIASSDAREQSPDA